MVHVRRFLSLLFQTPLILPAVMLFCLTACQQQAPRESKSPQVLTLAYSTSTSAVLAHIALIKGYTAEEGLEVTPQPHAFGKPALQAVLDGKADVATVADTPVMFAILEGRPIMPFAVIQTSTRNEAIVARRDRGIKVPGDLKHKKIGLTAGTTSDYFAEVLLQSQGIQRQDVAFVDMKPEQMAAALAAGSVDAVSAWNPTLLALQKRFGSAVVTFYADDLYTEAFCMAAKKDYIQRQPEAIRRVLRSLVKAELFVRAHPEEARRLVAEFLKTDKMVLDELWDTFVFRVSLDQSLLVNLEDQTRWAMKNRFAARRAVPNYLDYIYTEGLLAVKPAAVRIIR